MVITNSQLDKSKVCLSAYVLLVMERRMNSTAFSIISEPKRFRNLGNSGSEFLPESCGCSSGLSSGLSSEKQNRISGLILSKKDKEVSFIVRNPRALYNTPPHYITSYIYGASNACLFSSCALCHLFLKQTDPQILMPR